MLEVNVEARIDRLELAVSLSTGGEPLLLVGPNGAGKTSLLKLILGAIRPKSGRILLHGAPLFDATLGVDLPPEARGLGYVPQHYALFPHLSALDNVAFAVGSREPRLDRDACRKRAARQLDELEIGASATRRPEALSGGERQRVALARALAARPRALLLDEPLAALDAGARRQVRSFLAAYLAKLALPTIVVTHDVRDLAALGKVVTVLEAGKVVQQGSLAELERAPATPFVRELVADVG